MNLNDNFTFLKKFDKSLFETDRNKVFISSLHGSSKAFAVSKISSIENQTIVLLPDKISAEEFNVELKILNAETGTLLLTEFDDITIQEFLTTLNKNNSFVLISTYELLYKKLPQKEELSKSSTNLTAGTTVNYDEVLEYLNLLNYSQDNFVEAPGYYSVRGSIIDFWSFNERNPARLEFNGNLLESIRYFDPESQRSIKFTDTASIAAQINFPDSDSNNSTDIFSYLENPVLFVSDFNLNTAFPKQLTEKEESFEDTASDNLNSSVNSNKQTSMFEKENTFWIIEQEIISPETINLQIKEPPSVNGNYEVFFKVLKDFSFRNYKIIITSENELQTNRLLELLSDSNINVSDLLDKGNIKLFTLPIKQGFDCSSDKILLLTDYQLFNKPYRTKLPKKKKSKSKSKEFASIKKGDYVVHEDYGIGKYLGLETIIIGDVSQESMKILYNNNGIVYVNLNYLSLVKRYSSNENLRPNLSTLGTNDWANTKKKTKKKIKEAARELIELYAKRKSSKGYGFSPDTVWQKELEASFIYEDTPDQQKVTEDVKLDMQSTSPMDRLVCGDVGFGKTEIAVRAAFKAVQDGKQTAVLVPTTILAEQHFNTFKDRLSQFPVRVAQLSRFQSKNEQQKILENLKFGNVDIVIGTHRLLSKDIVFKDLGLLIIDEEHRFGVKAKEKLKQLKVNVDTLILTATPIPRTLNLSLLGARDLSILGTPPPNRQPINTVVSVFDIFKIKEWILNELNRGGQVYFVHDRVKSIEKLASYLQKYLPDISIGIAHGQMKPSQLENVIHNFQNKKFNVLLSTKIIESGIDMPNVNTIIVNRADRFGLAELHQLRGRVGRSDRQAYAYFLVPSLNGINKKSIRRLQAIEEFTEIGAGFNLAMRDLEIRGAGNLLGTEQSGFINDVGFDLYIKMINEAVEELKYQEFKDVFKSLPKQQNRTEPNIDTYFELGIPASYMPEQMDRLNFYTALYSVKSVIEINDLVDEMTDKYGVLPSMVNRLILASKLRFYASYALFERIIIQREKIIIILPNGNNEDYYKYNFIELMKFVSENFSNKIKFEQKNDILKLVMKNFFESPEKTLNYLFEFSQQIMNLFNNRPPELVAVDDDVVA